MSLLDTAASVASLDAPTIGTYLGGGAGLYFAKQLLKDADRRALDRAIRKGIPLSKPSHMVYAGLAGLASGIAAKALYDKLSKPTYGGGFYE